MLEFPFTHDEWEQVQAAALALTNAVLADDDVLAQSLRVELRAVLDALQDRYGDHPVLLETEADFEPQAESRVGLYEAALRRAEEHRLPTLSIRLSLAGVFIELGQFVMARQQLEQGRRELVAQGDEHDWSEWHELVRQCDRRSAT